MSEGTVARRYARALLELAKEKDALEAFGNELQLVGRTITESAEVESFLQHPGIDAKTKKDVVEKVFKDNVSRDVLSLLLLLIDRRRESILPDLVKEFVSLTNQARNVVDATVYTAVPLQEDEVQIISEKFGKTIGKAIRMTNETDPSIIAGLIIRIGDRLYDGSIGGKLSRFKQSLVQS